MKVANSSLALITTTTILLVLLPTGTSAQTASSSEPNLDYYINDYSSIVSSALSVATSYVAAHDMNSVISSGLSAAASYVSAHEHDVGALIASVAAEYDVTDDGGVGGVEEVWSSAAALWESLTMGQLEALGLLLGGGSVMGSTISEEGVVQETGTNGSGEGSVTETETAMETGAAVTTGAEPASMSSIGVGAVGWSAPAGVALGAFFLGLVAYL